MGYYQRASCSHQREWRRSRSAATAEQLDALDGIGPTTAQKIVAFRQAHGGFGSLQDLDKIPGIGPKRIGYACGPRHR